MNEHGMLMIVSGPSGCGKGTVLSELLSRRQDIVVSISVTTRPPRPGETDGVEYFFRTRDQFEQMIREDQLLEYAEYNGNYYGTPKQPIQAWLQSGRHVLLEIEVQGAEKVMTRCDDYVSVFISAPSLRILEARLRGRGTESEEVIEGRLAAAKRELAAAPRYQYIVINDEVGAAVERIEAILLAESLRYGRRYGRMKEKWMEEETVC